MPESREFVLPETVTLVGGPFDGRVVKYQGGIRLVCVRPNQTARAFSADDFLPKEEFAEYEYLVVDKGDYRTIEQAVYLPTHAEQKAMELAGIRSWWAHRLTHSEAEVKYAKD